VTPVAVLIMSDGELARADTLRDLDQDRLTIEAAQQLLGLSRRQIFRLLKAYRLQGAAGLISKKRGRPSNRKTPEDVRAAALAIVRERYADFGPTLAAEKLAEHHAITTSKETLRRWMLKDGLWLDRRRRLKRAYQPRYRRDCVGELVQVDGCEHWWFEDRGRQCTLLVFIDDATSRLMELRFVRTESTFAYFAALRAYLETHGKPVAFYTDKHVVFRVAKTDAQRGDGLTQFGRALHALNIDLICANSSQAKGRVERAHKTLQDRLVKELRLAGVSDIDAANAFLPAFMAQHNARFAREPSNDKDLHRPLAPRDDLSEAFTWRETRTITQALTLHYDRMVYVLDQTPQALAAASKTAEVVEYPDGRIVVRHGGADLPYRLFDKNRRVDQAAVVENKFFGPLLAIIREDQQRRDANTKPRRSIRPSREIRAN
jgi:transposase